MSPHPRLLALDPSSGDLAWRCHGPAPSGACPRIVVGALVPCVAHHLVNADAPGPPYTVPRAMTLCPITLALALDADTPLLGRAAATAGTGGCTATWVGAAERPAA